MRVFSILEGGIASAAILITFGAVLGKLNPFQLLVMSLIEGAVFVGNSYLGYKILGTLDVGKVLSLSCSLNAGFASSTSIVRVLSFRWRYFRPHFRSLLRPGHGDDESPKKDG